MGCAGRPRGGRFGVLLPEAPSTVVWRCPAACRRRPRSAGAMLARICPIHSTNGAVSSCSTPETVCHAVLRSECCCVLPDGRGRAGAAAAGSAAASSAPKGPAGAASSITTAEGGGQRPGGGGCRGAPSRRPSLGSSTPAAPPRTTQIEYSISQCQEALVVELSDPGGVPCTPSGPHDPYQPGSTHSAHA